MSRISYDGWIVVHASGTDYEAEIVRDRLDDAGVTAVVLTQRDHAFNLTLGELAEINVLVPPQEADQAQAILSSEPVTDAELEAAALSATLPEDEEDEAPE
ncbi:MAG: DUF2007 domain-containing protein [Bacteroidota bacterium]